MMIWAFVKTSGGGPIFAQHASLSGSRLAFAWLAAVNNALGDYATIAVNIPDFTVRPLSVLHSSTTPLTHIHEIEIRSIS